jgi:hypothetical protein
LLSLLFVGAEFISALLFLLLLKPPALLGDDVSSFVSVVAVRPERARGE